MISFLITLLAVLSLRVAAQDDAWHFDTIGILVNELLDPIVTPNANGPHMHKVLGGSKFGASYNYDTYNQASCSTVQVQSDKSNYWMPALYWHDFANSVYVQLPAHPRFYYFLNSASDPKRAVPFPKGLRMVAGSPENKVASSSQSFTCQINSDFTGDVLLDNFNFARDCPYGMKTELYFPQCWDGVNLYKSDGSHMMYNVGGSVRDGVCPLSHPVRVPSIQLEFTWFTSQYAPGTALNGNLMWANGDTTGYGIHGDFVNGWDLDVLGAAINSTACGKGGGESIPMQDCPILAAQIDANAAATCQPELGVLAEPTTNSDMYPVSSVPGCNLPWGASGPKPTCNPAVAGLDISAFTGTDGPYVVPAGSEQNLPLPIVPGWQPYACVANAASILNALKYSDAAITPDSCQQACLSSGYQYAAVGLIGTTFNCLCGSGLDPNAPYVPGECSTACPGNSSETCGGTYTFQTFYAPNGTTSSLAKTPSGAQVLGCYDNPTTAADGLLGAATYSFSSSGMTTEVCNSACSGKGAAWAATTGGQDCYCGTKFNYGQGTFVPSSFCTVKCTGNSSEICGDTYRSSVYNLTTALFASSSIFHPAGWQGCFAEGSGHLALQNTSWSRNDMTPMECINGCSELGFSYAGVEAADRCYCGDSFKGGQQLPQSQCSSPCAGNSSAVCGGVSNLDLYNMEAATVSQATVQASRPSTATYLGCFLDSGSGVLTNYSYSTATMTVETCLTACVGFKYPYAGVENGNQCKCGSSPPSTARMPSAQYCASTCVGDEKETCGAGGYVEAYSLVANTTKLDPVGGSSGVEPYLGCYTDSTKGLSTYKFSLTNMTIDICRTSCHELGYSLGGVDSGTDCYCGDAWTGGQILPDSSCTTKCPGNSTQICGGSSVISLYNTTGAAAIPTQPAGWSGCYAEPSTGRGLTAYSYSTTPMSSKVCRTECLAKGYALAGTEGGNQCFCGNTLTSGTTRLPAIMCTTPCDGVTTGEICGGIYRFDLYNTTGATVSTTGVQGFLGCYTDSSAINTYSFVSDYMSVDICNKACYARSFAYAGVYDGNQCRCGNTPPVTLTTTSTCSATNCTANSMQYCGASSAIAVYKLADAGITDASYNMTAGPHGLLGCFKDSTNTLLSLNAFSSSTMTNAMCASNCASLSYAYAGTNNGKACYCTNKLNTTSPAYQVQTADCNVACGGGGGDCGASGMFSVYSVATTSYTPVAAAAEGYKGCYTAGTFFSAPKFQYASSTMQPNLCRRTCRNLGYSVAGLTNGNTCSCGSDITYGSLAAPDYCADTCTGNSSLICGANFNAAFSIYDTTGAGAQPPSGYPANYIGCYSDTSPRLLPAYDVTVSGMSAGYCQKVCSGQGYSVYGTEDGNQCFCSSSVPTAGLILDSSCSSNCGGLPTEKCGAGGILSVYNGDAKALNSTSPFGNATTTIKSSTASQSSTPTAKSTFTSMSSVKGSVTTTMKSTSVSNLSTATPKSTIISISSVKGSVSTTSTIKSSSTSKSSSAIAKSTSISISSVKGTANATTTVQSSSASKSSTTSAKSTSTAISSLKATTSSRATTSSGAITSSRATASSSATASVPKTTSKSSTGNGSSSTGALMSKSGTASRSTSSISTVASVIKTTSNSSAVASVPTATFKSSSTSPRPTSSSSAAASVIKTTSVAASMSTTASRSNVGTLTTKTTSASSSYKSSSTQASTPTTSKATSNTVNPASSTTKTTTAVSATKVTTSTSTTSSTAASTIKPFTGAAVCTTKSTASISSSGPTSTPTVDSNFAGCYTGATNAFIAGNMTCISLTPAMCKQWCNENDYKYAGTSNGDICGCSNDISALDISDPSYCNSPCIGDTSKLCGGQFAFGVYDSSPTVSKVKRRVGTPDAQAAHRRSRALI